MNGTDIALSAVAVLAATGLVRQRGSGARRSSTAPSVAELRASLLADAPSGSRNASAEPSSPSRLFLRMEPFDVPDDLLVAVLLSGTTTKKSSLEVAQDLLRSARGNLSQVVHHIPTMRGVGETGRARLLAASELYRRANYRAQAGQKLPLTGPEDSVELIKAMALGDVEQLVAIYIDRGSNVIATRRLSVGSDSATVVDPRVIFRHGIQVGAAALIMAHNHPSGNKSPSPQDRAVTERVKSAGRVIGITLLDHIIVVRGGEDGWTSLAQMGLL